MLNSRNVVYVYIENDGLKLTSTLSGTRSVNESNDQD
jgi:hypothetical protein